MIRAFFASLILPAALLLSGCNTMEVATGSRIQPATTPGYPPTPLQSDAQRTAIYNSSGQGVIASPAPGTPRTPPLQEQASEINSRKLPDVPANQSTNLSPEQRSQQQVPQPEQLPRP